MGGMGRSGAIDIDIDIDIDIVGGTVITAGDLGRASAADGTGCAQASLFCCSLSIPTGIIITTVAYTSQHFPPLSSQIHRFTDLWPA